MNASRMSLRWPVFIVLAVILAQWVDGAESGLPPGLPPEVQKRILALKKRFDLFVAENSNAPYEKDYAALNSKVQPALELEQTIAAKKKDLDGLIWVKSALECLSKGTGLTEPPPQANKSLTRIYTIYQTELKRLGSIRHFSLVDASERYDKGLKEIQDELTEAQKPNEAVVVRGIREFWSTSEDKARLFSNVRPVTAPPIPKPAEAPPAEPVATAPPMTKPAEPVATAVPPMTKPAEPVQPAAKTLDSVLTNSLGMKFVPVSGTKVLFCIHETRRQDYMAFAAEVKEADPGWKKVVQEGLAVGHEDDHPVVNVPWEWAKNFCEWLSKKEGKVYRLPTDKEWSYAVGIGNSEKWTKSATPESLNGKVEGYPWGKEYPPKELVGNYADRSYVTRIPISPLIPGYTDGFATTAPVMSFKPNQNGLYDMGGNVWEWIEDWWNEEKVQHVLRGGCFFNLGESLRSSNRSLFDGGIKWWGTNGFRVVLEPAPVVAVATAPPMTKPAEAPPAVPVATAPPMTKPAEPEEPAAETLDSVLTNSLGMKFVPVSGTKVLFCIHETRRQDYSAFAAENPGTNKSWQNVRYKGASVGWGDDHPVVAVSWDDAQSFCAWLSKKEGRTYRLPTDREWSVAVGIGADEKIRTDTTPESLSGSVENIYPWGVQWPPPKGAGNYADTSLTAELPAEPVIQNYTDGHSTTAPVMTFNPNKLGIFDMGGNVWEWCEDWANEDKHRHVLRGASWSYYGRTSLLSSRRNYMTPDYRQMTDSGFRCVLETVKGGR